VAIIAYPGKWRSEHVQEDGIVFFKHGEHVRASLLFRISNCADFSWCAQEKLYRIEQFGGER
jgi:hypothetical protein